MNRIRWRRVRRWTATVCCTALASAAAFAAGAADGDPHIAVTWRGKSVVAEARPAELEALLPALEPWNAWALANRYRVEVDVSGRLAMFVPEGLGGVARYREGAEKALDMLDRRAPRPAAPEEAEKRGDGPVGGGEIPEDPEGAPRSTSRPFEETLRGTTTQWGAGSRPFDTEPMVMFALRDERDFATLLDRLVEVAPSLAPWRAGAEQFPGFALEHPLIGAVVLGASGQEEFDPENEVVHRAAELSLLRRFGRQPYWVLQGWAWHVELSVRKSVYCFPYRNGFVGIGEHGQWDKSLRSMWAKSKSAPNMADLAALGRGTWDDRGAKHAWGAVSFFDKFHSDALPALLIELQASWDKGSRRDLGAGRWERDAHFELPHAEQQRILEAHGTPQLLEDLKRYFAQGAGPVKPRH